MGLLKREPARGRDQPLPPPARRQPGALAALGREGARRRTRPGPADPALDRLRRLPLVPRDGARVVRGRGDRGADERELREREGRPGGAPRPRRGLHGGGRRDDGPGRLADDRLPHPGRRAVLRRHLLPARGAPRSAELPPGAGGARRSLAGAAGGGDELGRAARGGGAALEHAAPLDRSAHRRPRARGAAGATAELRAGVRRLGPRAEVPERTGARARAAARRRSGRARAGDEDARRDGRRWDVRPARRWLPPLLGRRALARAALREDAL